VAPSLIATDMMGGRTDLARNIPLGRWAGPMKWQAVAMVLGNDYMPTDHRPQRRHGVHLTRAVSPSPATGARRSARRGLDSFRRSRQEAVSFDRQDLSHDGCHLSR
jgi:hypothetical protein